MKLLFIFTGGTIGSTSENGVISPDAGKPYLLLEKYTERHPVDFIYDTLALMNELSENFTGDHIARILCAVNENAAKYDGIIVTHGTDTLSYTAAALGYAMGNESIPVCLVSSAYPLEDTRENGVENLFGAISLIRHGTEKGVFVPYQNEKRGSVTIHRATRLSSSLAFLHQIYSVNDTYYGTVDADGVFHKNPDFHEEPDAAPPPEWCSLRERSRGVLRIQPYPGMVYPPFPDVPRAVLLDTFHSGTIEGKSHATHAFLKAAQKKEIPVFVTGNAAYESAKIFDKYDVVRLPLSPIAAYMKLWLYGADADLSLSRGGDVF